MMNEEQARKFIREIIEAGEWDLRYSPKSLPYAALPEGFGNKEPNIKLHFIPDTSRIKVVGVIDYSKEIGLTRPSVFISIYKSAEEAVEIIKEDLLPRYAAGWRKAQSELSRCSEQGSDQ